MAHLSALGGRYFGDRLLALCDAGHNANHVVLIDTRRKSARQLTDRGGRTSPASFDYSGRSIIVQGGTGSPSRAMKMVLDSRSFQRR